MKWVEIVKLLCDFFRKKKTIYLSPSNQHFCENIIHLFTPIFFPNFEVQSTTYLGSRWGNPNFVLVSGVIYVLITTRRSIYRFYIRGSLRWGGKWAGHGTAAWEICRRKSDFQKVSWCGFESIYYTMSSQVWPFDPWLARGMVLPPEQSQKRFGTLNQPYFWRKRKRRELLEYYDHPWLGLNPQGKLIF